MRWFGPPPTVAADDRAQDWILAGWSFLVVGTVKWIGALWLLAPYDLETSPWHFGYEAGHIAGNLAAGHGFSIAGDGGFLPTAYQRDLGMPNQAGTQAPTQIARRSIVRQVRGPRSGGRGGVLRYAEHPAASRSRRCRSGRRSS